MRRAAAVVLTMVLGLGLVACQPSNDDDLESKALDATPAPTLDGVDPFDPSMPVDPSAPVEPADPSDEALAVLYDLLLTPSELGPDWAYEEDSGSTVGSLADGDGPDCFAALEDVIPYRDSAEAGYDREDGNYFAESISLPGAAVVATEFDQIVAALDACPVVTFGDGTDAVSGTMAPVPMTLGDRSRGWEMVVSDDIGTWVMDVGVVGVGDHALVTFAGFLEAPDQATFQQLTALAVDKILRGGGQTA